MASSTRAVSLTVHAIGPIVSLDGDAGIMPNRLTSGVVGRRPTRLPCDAGPRTEPPVSSPIPTAPKFAATPMPVPQDDPLAKKAGSYALWQSPNADPEPPAANSPIFVFARMMAPARCSRSTTVALRLGTKVLNIAEP